MVKRATLGLPSPQRDWALFFDIDGTLIDIAPTPDAVIVPASLRENLATLHRSLGAVALVSGRPLGGIDRLFAPLVLPASGQHGAEQRLDRERIVIPPLPALRSLVTPLQQFAAAHPGILIEDKGNSVAVHYRAVPRLADEVRALADRLVEGSLDLEAMPASMAVDIKPRALSKGDAVAWFMARPPFAGRVPVFVGDDVTDETGFAAVNERGGYSIRVGDLGHGVARWSIKSSATVREWVADLARYYGQAARPRSSS
jgi:trehalose 6-phosphate phosphatase